MNGHGNANLMSSACGYSCAAGQNGQPAAYPRAGRSTYTAGQTAARGGTALRAVSDTADTGSDGALTSITPATLQSTDYFAGLLSTFIGQRVRVQFLIGTTGPMIDIVGDLEQVGANYITLRLTDSDDLIVCDMFSIKFVTVFR